MRMSLIAALLIACVGSAGQDSAKPRPHARHLLMGYPLVFYTPETRMGFGLAGFYGFQPDTTDSLTPISQIQPAVMYTVNRQYILTLPFQWFSRQRQHSLYGEITFNRFFYRFFGSSFALPAVTNEQYEVEFPRIRLHYLYRLGPAWYAGARYWLEEQRILQTEEGGLLGSGKIPGGSGGRSAGPGIVLQYDTRDHVISTRRGTFAELSWHHQSSATGSDFDFNRFRLDARAFIPAGRRGTMATMIMAEHIYGDPPFFSMAALGNDRRMRGYFDGYFRDKSLCLAQAEYRRGVWKNLYLAAFASAAWMGETPKTYALPGTIWTAGAGMRWVVDPNSRVTLRLDYARGQHSDALYFTMGEAF